MVKKQFLQYAIRKHATNYMCSRSKGSSGGSSRSSNSSSSSKSSGSGSSSSSSNLLSTAFGPRFRLVSSRHCSLGAGQ